MVISTVLEMFYQNLYRKALVLVNPSEVEIFLQDLYRKALILVNLEVIKISNPLRRPRGFRQCQAPTLTHFMAMIQPLFTSTKWNMGEI